MPNFFISALRSNAHGIARLIFEEDKEILQKKLDALQSKLLQAADEDKLNLYKYDEVNCPETLNKALDHPDIYERNLAKLNYLTYSDERKKLNEHNSLIMRGANRADFYLFAIFYLMCRESLIDFKKVELKHLLLLIRMAAEFHADWSAENIPTILESEDKDWETRAEMRWKILAGVFIHFEVYKHLGEVKKEGLYQPPHFKKEEEAIRQIKHFIFNKKFDRKLFDFFGGEPIDKKDSKVPKGIKSIYEIAFNDTAIKTLQKMGTEASTRLKKSSLFRCESTNKVYAAIAELSKIDEKNSVILAEEVVKNLKKLT